MLDKNTLEIEFELSKPFKLVSFPDLGADNFTGFNSNLDLKCSKATEHLKSEGIYESLKHTFTGNYPEVVALKIIECANRHINVKR